jgi:elongator complex protein 3
MERTPEYCRLTRVIRDIPGTDIVDGNRLTNFRELAEAELDRSGRVCRDIRAREIRHEPLIESELRLESVEYPTSVGRELFLQYLTVEDRLAAFLRLSLPAEPVLPEEVAESAMIREVHVYGVLTGLGESGNGRSQHAGLGARLIERASELAREAGYSDLAVISSIGTREYYRRLGFADGLHYQHLEL